MSDDQDLTDGGTSPSSFGPPGRPFAGSPFRFGLLFGFGFALVVLTLVALHLVSSVLVGLLAAGFVAVGLNRPVLFLGRHGIRRGTAVWIIAAIGLAAMVGFLALALPLLIDQADALFAALPGYLDKVFGSDPDKLGQEIGRVLTPGNVQALLGGVLGGALSLLWAVFLGLGLGILTLFILASYDRLRTGVYRLVPASRRARASALGDEILAKVGGYLVGAVTIAAIAGTTSLIFMLIAGIPYAFLLCLVVAALDMVPQIGATIGAAAVVAVALAQSLTLAIVSVLFFLVYQQFENWVIYPRMMSHAVHISNLAALVSVLIGGALLGVLGVLVAVPVYAAVQLIVREVFLPRQEAS